MNRVPARRYERIFEKKAVFFRKHYGRRTVTAYKIALFASNLAKSIIWSLLWGLGKANAGEEAKTHWNMVRNVFFF